MRNGLIRIWTVVHLLAVFGVSCTAEQASDPAPTLAAPGDARVTDLSALPEDAWLEGDLQAQLLQLQAHIGGMGAAMLTIGQRHAELYWAGRDANWPYAAHQLDELTEVMEDALVRRPRYAEAAAPWLEDAVPAMASAIEAEDVEGFLAAYDVFTVACNVCHGVTDHAFVQVHPPESRSVNVRREIFTP